MTKDNQQHTQYTVPRTKRCSRIRASAPRRSNEYYEALINTVLYTPKLGSKEAHEARYQARLSVVHSETSSQAVRQEAARDIRLHGQSITRRKAKELCLCPNDWLICLCK